MIYDFMSVVLVTKLNTLNSLQV